MPQEGLQALDVQVLSDHLPVKLTLREANSAAPNGPKRMRSQLLASFRLQNLIREDWMATRLLMSGQPTADILS